MYKEEWAYIIKQEAAQISYETAPYNDKLPTHLWKMQSTLKNNQTFTALPALGLEESFRTYTLRVLPMVS